MYIRYERVIWDLLILDEFDPLNRRSIYHNFPMNDYFLEFVQNNEL